MITKVAIVGVGLIGSSLGLALQELEKIEKVVGIDKDSNHLNQALDIGAINEQDELEKGVKDADLIVLATPVETIKRLLEKLKPYVKEGAIITDVGSTKSNIVAKAENLVEQQHFIGGHPMTGSEVVGPAGADKYLFENAFYILTRTEKTNQKSLSELERIFSAIGAQVLILSPEYHDKIVAVTSHLPHALAVSLVASLMEYGGDDDLFTSLIAGGFRDTTRVAAGDSTMWRDIFLCNQEFVLDSIEVLQDNLAKLKQLISQDSKQELFTYLEEVREYRLKLPMKKKGLLPSNYELLITLKDEPNAIGKMASKLGDKGINIQDIEVLKVRDQGGTLRTSFRHEEEQLEACEILEQEGYKVIIK